MSSTVNVYQVNDIEWYAAVSPEQAKAYERELCGDGPFVSIDPEWCYLVSDEEMQRKMIVDVDGDYGPAYQSYTWATWLKLCLENGEAPPFIFAVEE